MAGEECPICLQIGELYPVCENGHKFHMECILKIEKQECPMCRVDIKDFFSSIKKIEYSYSKKAETFDDDHVLFNDDALNLVNDEFDNFNISDDKDEQINREVDILPVRNNIQDILRNRIDRPYNLLDNLLDNLPNNNNNNPPINLHQVNLPPLNLQNNNPQVNDAHLFVDYVYLDAKERQQFARAAYDYQIKPIQNLDFRERKKGSKKGWNYPKKGSRKSPRNGKKGSFKRRKY